MPHAGIYTHICTHVSVTLENIMICTAKVKTCFGIKFKDAILKPKNKMERAALLLN